METVTSVIVLVLAVLITAASAAVVKFYAQLRARIPRRGGLLLWHVIAIATGTVVLWATLAAGQLSILGIVDTPRWTRLVGYSIGGALTFVALVIIATTSRRVTTGPVRTIVRQERDTVFEGDHPPAD